MIELSYKTESKKEGRNISAISAYKVTTINGETHTEKIMFDGSNKVFCGTVNDDLFYFTNIYLNTLTNQQKELHWSLLKQAKRILDPGYFDEPENEEIEALRAGIYDYKRVSACLRDIFIQLYDNLELSRLKFAAQCHNVLDVPKNLNSISNQGDYPKETTIDGAKYVELALLAFTSRFVLPVVNNLIHHFKSHLETASSLSVFGDMLCSIPAIKNHPGMAVLTTYIAASLKRRNKDTMQTDIFHYGRPVENLTSRGVINRLPLSHIPSRSKDKNLSNELNSLVSGDTKTKGHTKIKNLGDGGAEGRSTYETKSIQENYKIFQDINTTDELAIGEYFTFSLIYEPKPGVYAKHEKNFFKHQCTGLGIKNQKMAEQIYLSLPPDRVFHLTLSHIKVLQLVYAGEIPQGVYQSLNYDQLMCALSLAQVKLFEMGFEQLAIFIMSVKNMDDEESRINELVKLDPLEKEYLNSICGDAIEGDDRDNSVVYSVEGFLKELFSSKWISNIEEDVLGSKNFKSILAAKYDYNILFDASLKTEMIKLIKLRNS